MEIRIFQIIVPALSIIYIAYLILRLSRSRSTFSETALGVLFWLSVCIFSIFPDKISEFIARTFGIEDNVNAIIFFTLGFIFFLLFKLYLMHRRQAEDLTELTRQLAMKRDEEEEKV